MKLFYLEDWNLSIISLNELTKEYIPQSAFIIVKGIKEHHLKVSSLTHHPEVGWYCEVCHDRVEHTAPQRVIGPRVRVVDDNMVPQQPADVAADDADEHVDVDSVPATVKTPVTGEYHQSQ